MSEFWLYFNMGLHHVLSWQAIHLILFLVVIVAVLSFNDWVRLLWLITLFTLGHSLAVALSIFGIIMVQGVLVNFLIPLTVFLTALFCLFTAGKNPRHGKLQLLYFASLFFGIIHGLGFSGHFRAVTAEASGKLLPLLEFALGLEAGQIIVVVIALIISFVVQTIFRFSKRDWVMVISSIVIGVMLPFLIENKFW